MTCKKKVCLFLLSENSSMQLWLQLQGENCTEKDEDYDSLGTKINHCERTQSMDILGAKHTQVPVFAELHSGGER